METPFPLYRVMSLSVHDNFGTKWWTVSVHDDFGTYEIRLKHLNLDSLELRRLSADIIWCNKNSSGDEIANVNFYAVCRKLPEFAEMTQNNAITPFKVIQGHSRSPILVPIESLYTISH